MLISITFFGYWGYHLELLPEAWGKALGLVLGLVVAIIATPIVFLLLMLLIHSLIKLEDLFKAKFK